MGVVGSCERCHGRGKVPAWLGASGGSGETQWGPGKDGESLGAFGVKGELGGTPENDGVLPWGGLARLGEGP